VIHEQYTLTGEVEITDSRTMQVMALKRTFTALWHCVLCGERFAPDDQVEAIFPAHVDLADTPGGGPWTPGGRSARWLKARASKIVEMGRTKTIHLQK